MEFATALALCTNCRLATGFVVFELATLKQASLSNKFYFDKNSIINLQELHRALVCLAIMVAASNTCFCGLDPVVKASQPFLIAWDARANCAWSTKPGLPAIEVLSETPTYKRILYVNKLYINNCVISKSRLKKKITNSRWNTNSFVNGKCCSFHKKKLTDIVTILIKWMS